VKHNDDAPFDFSGLDRVFHEKARLGIVSSLSGYSDGLAFSELKQLCALTDGNLSRHLQVLEQAGYIQVEKAAVGRRTRTRCRLSGEGRKCFAEYLRELERVLRRAALGGAALIDNALQPG